MAGGIDVTTTEVCDYLVGGVYPRPFRCIAFSILGGVSVTKWPIRP
ncbi:hypothetical protein [Bradyrhizobium sp. IC4061]